MFGYESGQISGTQSDAQMVSIMLTSTQVFLPCPITSRGSATKVNSLPFAREPSSVFLRK
jgi:hypothetical protein